MKILTLSFVCIALSGLAYRPVMPEMSADEKAEIERKTGGRVMPPATGKAILLVNTSVSARSADPFGSFMKYADSVMRLPVISTNDIRDISSPYDIAKSFQLTRQI